MDNQNQVEEWKKKVSCVLDAVYPVFLAFLLGFVFGLTAAFYEAIPLFLTDLHTLADAIRVVHSSW